MCIKNNTLQLEMNDKWDTGNIFKNSNKKIIEYIFFKVQVHRGKMNIQREGVGAVFLSCSLTTRCNTCKSRQ